MINPEPQNQDTFMKRHKLIITFLSGAVNPSKQAITENKRNNMTNTSVNRNKTLNVLRLIVGLAAGVMFVRHDATAVQALVSLGSAAKFAVLAATTVTSVGATT